MAVEVVPGSRGHVLIAPDSFKGSTNAANAALAMEIGAIKAGWSVDCCPMSDGGEGFLDVVSSADAKSFSVEVTGPLGKKVVAEWRMAGTLAVIESAQANGLALAGGPRGNNPMTATTYGVGELIAAAVAGGAQTILVGVGGSATTDGGKGAVDAIEAAGGLKGATLRVAVDVATLFEDAARVFGPQKGANPEQVDELSERLTSLRQLYLDTYSIDVQAIAGSGAAGGLSGALAALGATLAPGFDLVADAVHLEERIAASDCVITGEGQLDVTSWVGKVIGGIVGLAAKTERPVIAVVGNIADSAKTAIDGKDVGLPPRFEAMSISARFGRNRSFGDTEGCLTDIVFEALSRPEIPNV